MKPKLSAGVPSSARLEGSGTGFVGTELRTTPVPPEHPGVPTQISAAKRWPFGLVTKLEIDTLSTVKLSVPPTGEEPPDPQPLQVIP